MLQNEGGGRGGDSLLALSSLLSLFFFPRTSQYSAYRSRGSFQSRDIFHAVIVPIVKKQVMSRCLRACLNGSGGPQVGEVTRLGGVKK